MPEGWIAVGAVRARATAVAEVSALGLASGLPRADLPLRVLREAKLHRTLSLLAPSGEERILKIHRGRPPLDLLRDLLGGKAFAPSARLECENLDRLRDEHFPVPEALAWGPCPTGGTFALLRPVEGIPLDEWLRSPAADIRVRRARLFDLASLVARFHEGRRFHRDLYACHVLVGEGGTLSLIDLARARRGRIVRRRWFVKDLAALALSVPSPPVTRADRVRFLLAYLAARGSRKGPRRWMRAIDRRLRRMRGHRPRDG